MIMYACGTYAVKFLSAYLDHTEKLARSGQSRISQFNFGICSDFDNFDLPLHDIYGDDTHLFRCEIRGRLSTTSNHKVFILIDKEKESLDRFNEYHCDCKSGQRTNSCCLHVVTALCLLGGGLRDPRNCPASHLQNFATRI